MYSSGGTLASTGVGVTILGTTYSVAAVAAVGALIVLLGAALTFAGFRSRRNG